MRQYPIDAVKALAKRLPAPEKEGSTSLIYDATENAVLTFITNADIVSGKLYWTISSVIEPTYVHQGTAPCVPDGLDSLG